MTLISCSRPSTESHSETTELVSSLFNFISYKQNEKENGDFSEDYASLIGAFGYQEDRIGENRLFIKTFFDSDPVSPDGLIESDSVVLIRRDFIHIKKNGDRCFPFSTGYIEGKLGFRRGLQSTIADSDILTHFYTKFHESHPPTKRAWSFYRSPSDRLKSKEYVHLEIHVSRDSLNSERVCSISLFRETPAKCGAE